MKEENRNEADNSAQVKNSACKEAHSGNDVVDDSMVVLSSEAESEEKGM